jgi:formate hydrogenlyase subunit 4
VAGLVRQLLRAVVAVLEVAAATLFLVAQEQQVKVLLVALVRAAAVVALVPLVVTLREDFLPLVRLEREVQVRQIA